MQEKDKTKLEANKKLLLNALAKTVTELRGAKSQFILCSENDISTSILSLIERGEKDPQLTTVFRIAEAFDLSVLEFLQKLCDKLPDNFEMIDK